MRITVNSFPCKAWEKRKMLLTFSLPENKYLSLFVQFLSCCLGWSILLHFQALYKSNNLIFVCFVLRNHSPDTHTGFEALKKNQPIICTCICIWWYKWNRLYSNCRTTRASVLDPWLVTIYSFIHTCIFSNCFIQVRIVVDLELTVHKLGIQSIRGR